MLQQRMSRVGRIGFGVVLLSSLWSAQAQTNVSLYRYQISLRSGDFEYRDSIPAVVPPSGPYYKVETDRQGRIVRQTSMRSGKELATTQYDYQGAGKLYFRSEKFINGEQTGIEQVQRSASGIIVRKDDQTAQGVLTSYTVIKEASDPSEMEFYTYDASGKCVTHEKDAFDPNGVTIKAFTYPSPTSDAAVSSMSRRNSPTAQMGTSCGVTAIELTTANGTWDTSTQTGLSQKCSTSTPTAAPRKCASPTMRNDRTVSQRCMPTTNPFARSPMIACPTAQSSERWRPDPTAPYWPNTPPRSCGKSREAARPSGEPMEFSIRLETGGNRIGIEMRN
jgi:hypothetical protein